MLELNDVGPPFVISVVPSSVPPVPLAGHEFAPVKEWKLTEPPAPLVIPDRRAVSVTDCPAVMVFEGIREVVKVGGE